MSGFERKSLFPDYAFLVPELYLFREWGSRRSGSNSTNNADAPICRSTCRGRDRCRRGRRRGVRCGRGGARVGRQEARGSAHPSEDNGVFD